KTGSPRGAKFIEISEHLRQGSAHLASRRDAARACTRRRAVHAGGDCAAFAGGTGGVSQAAVHGSLLPRGAAICHSGCSGGSALASRESGDQLSREARFALAGTAHSGAVSRADAG